MIRLIQFLIFGHIHKWDVFKELEVSTTYRNGEDLVEQAFVLQCKHCGNLKRFGG